MAADSALNGQSAARKVAILTALLQGKSADVEDLLLAMDATNGRLDAVTRQRDIANGQAKAAEKTLRVQKGRATRKTLLSALVLFGAGFIVGSTR